MQCEDNSRIGGILTGRHGLQLQSILKKSAEMTEQNLYHQAAASHSKFERHQPHECCCDRGWASSHFPSPVRRSIKLAFSCWTRLQNHTLLLQFLAACSKGEPGRSALQWGDGAGGCVGSAGGGGCGGQPVHKELALSLGLLVLDGALNIQVPNS